MKTYVPSKIYNIKENKKNGVNVVVSNSQGKILVLKRNPFEFHYPNLWDLPGGKVENNETLHETAEREAKEESGLDVELEQKYFYVYNCQDKELNIYGFKAGLINGDVTTSEEHTEFKWVSRYEWKSLEYTPSVKATIEEFFRR